VEGYSELNIKGQRTVPGKNSLQDTLEQNKNYEFKLIQDEKKAIRNGLLLIVLSIGFGAGVGAIIDLIYLYTGITNEYAIMGIGSGVGAILGVFLGLILLAALKSKMVDDFSSSYGAGIGTNVFVGSVIGLFFGVIVGSLFGLILEVLKFTNVSNLSLPVFAILIWTVLGLNIGALVGVIASFGTNITIGGAIAGVIVGAIGMLAIFGPDVLIAVGGAIGLVMGIINGIFIKYGLEANKGKVEYPKFCGKMTSCTEKSGSSFLGEPRRDTRKKRAPSSNCGGCGSGNDCSGCGSGGDEDCVGCCAGVGGAGGAGGAGGCGACGGCGGCTIGSTGIAALLAIPIILLIIGLSFKFGGTVKRGALSAIGASFSILLIIGSNVGLTEAYHNMLFEHNVLIGAGIGLIYGVMIFAIHRLSIKKSFIEINISRLTWMDRHTTASVKFDNIRDYEFTRELRTDLKKEGCYEDYFKFTTYNESREKVLINCWATPEGSDPTEHIQTILEYYLSKREIPLATKKTVDELFKDEIAEEQKMETKSKTSEISGYSFDLNPAITQNMVNNITNLIEKPKSVSITWLCAVTSYEKEIVEEIITMHLGLVIDEGKVVK